MIEAEPVRLGPFLLPVATLAVAVLVYFSAKAADRLLPEERALWSERFGVAILLYLILYKISPLFTDPTSVLHHPSSILYLSGSPKGAIVAGGITAVYLAAAFRRLQIPFSRWLDAAALVALFTGIGYSIIFHKWGKPTDLPWGIFIGEGVRVHPIHGYRFLLLAVILFWWWRNRNRLHPGEIFAWTSLAGGIGLLILSYFDWEPLTVWLNLSWSQWAFIGIAVAGWLGSLVFARPERRNRYESA